MHRHEDDAPKLIRNEEEWKAYMKEHEWYHNTFWVDDEDDLDFPCMVYSIETEARCGRDYMDHYFFFVEDAEELLSLLR